MDERIEDENQETIEKQPNAVKEGAAKAGNAATGGVILLVDALKGFLDSAFMKQFEGKKTYLSLILAKVGIVLGLFTGELSIAEAIAGFGFSSGAASMKHGLDRKKEENNESN